MSAIIPERIVNELPTLSNVAISPDGATIVYVRTQVNAETGKPESQIWRCDRDGCNRRQLTHVGTGNGSPVWSPDGSQLAFTSQREGDLPAAICLLRLDGGEAEVLTQHMTPPMGLTWSPDGATLAYSLSVDPENPNETPRDPNAPAPVRVVRNAAYKVDGMGYRGDVHTQIFLFDLATRERRQVTSEPVDHMAPHWSPDGKTIAVNLWADGPLQAQIGLVDVETGETRRIGEPSPFLGSFSWSPNGERILFEIALADYGLVDVASGNVRPLIENNPAFMPGGAFDPSGGVVWIDDSTVIAPGFAAGASGLWQIDLETGIAVEKGRWPAMHGGIASGSTATGIVQDISDLSGVTGLVSIDAESGERTVLFDEAKELFAGMPLAQWERISVERGDLTIEGFLLKPADFDERKSYPVIVDIHGGPQGMQLYRVDPVSQHYATNGFLVVQPDPRGSTSYGRAFSEAVYEDWGYEDWKDIQALLDHVLERPYADKERTGVYGYSYGGYMTSWAIGQTDRFKAAVCGAPCFDLESMYGTSDISYILGAMQWGGTPWENREWLVEHSPSSHIHKAVTPTLIVQGEADERCPVGQAEQMFISLKKIGVETEFARYPGGFHAFPWNGEPAHRIDYLKRTLAWFKKYLGDTA
ncbi:MAG: S9 family peptidase [Thermomicrobiales bacterium]